MVYDFILVRYGELTLKGHNKNDFIKRLNQNIKSAFSSYPQLDYFSKHDRLFIALNGMDGRELIKKLETVFGISSFSLALRCDNDITAIQQKALSLTQNSKAQTFKVNARRSDKRFPMISDQINRQVAAVILSHTQLQVDVHQPELTLLIEVRDDGTYIMDNKYWGGQGLPLGSSDRALLLLSGGIDSVVAGYLTMKKGVSLHCLHFESAPYTSLQALNKVRDLCRKLSFYQGQIILHIISFTKMQLAINKAVPESYTITIMRRMMLRIAEKLALANNCLALVSGESIGQVASQTLASMQVIGEVVNIPLIRPLVSYDKVEIINLAKKLETYEISCLPYEDCCTIFTPKNPTTKPNSAKALRYESELSYNELIQEALENQVIEVIKYNEDKE